MEGRRKEIDSFISRVSEFTGAVQYGEGCSGFWVRYFAGSLLLSIPLCFSPLVIIADKGAFL